MLTKFQNAVMVAKNARVLINIVGEDDEMNGLEM